jgi:hypothetical protein
LGQYRRLRGSPGSPGVCSSPPARWWRIRPTGDAPWNSGRLKPGISGASAIGERAVRGWRPPSRSRRWAGCCWAPRGGYATTTKVALTWPWGQASHSRPRLYQFPHASTLVVCIMNTDLTQRQHDGLSLRKAFVPPKPRHDAGPAEESCGRSGPKPSKGVARGNTGARILRPEK